MDKTEKLLLDTLAFFAGKKDVKFETDAVDGDKLFELSKKHGVTGIVGYAVKKNNLFTGKDIYRRILHEYDRTIMKMSGKEYAAEHVFEELGKSGIQHIIFKGTTVSACYPVRELRTFGDVDMLIHESDVSRVCELMRELGFAHRIEDEGVVNAFFKGQEKYEMHTSLNLPSIEEKCFYDPWSNTIRLGGETYTFEHNYHLCFLISHIEKHLRGSGAGVRMYLDIALYIEAHRDKLDLEAVRERLSLCSLERLFDTVLYACNRWFGTDIPRLVSTLDDDIFEKFCDFTISGGVFGITSDGENIKNAVRNELSNGKRGARTRLLMSRVFPSKNELKRMYPPSQGRHFSAVSAWFRHTGDVLRHKKLSRIKEIATADVESAESKSDFFAALGCMK